MRRLALMACILSFFIFAACFNLGPLLALDMADSPAGKTSAIRPQAEYSASNLRDPFIMPPKKEAVGVDVKSVTVQPLPALTVSGIIWGGDFSQAIINNKVVRVGDMVDTVKIIEINKDYIGVLFSGNKYKLNSPISNDIVNKSEGGAK